MKSLLLLITVFTYSYTSAQTKQFVPDITTCSTLLKKQTTKEAFDKLLPEFTVDSSKIYDYNKETGERDLFMGMRYFYEFRYKKDWEVKLQTQTDKARKIKQFDFEFDIMPTFFKRQQQLTANGYVFNEYSSEVGTKLNLGQPLYYYNAGKLTVVLEESLYKFTIFKADK